MKGNQQLTAMDLAREFAYKLYAEGHVFAAMDQADADIIVCGPRTTGYARGVEDAQLALQAEMEAIAPARLSRMHLHRIRGGDGLAVRGSVVIHAPGEPRSMLHQLELTYRRDGGALRLIGVRIARDLYAERRYRAICAIMLGATLERIEAETNAGDAMRTYIRAALLAYRITSGRRLLEYSDEFWQILNYESDEQMRLHIGDEMMRLVSPGDQARIQATITRQLLAKDIYQVEYRMSACDGQDVWVLECGRRHLDDGGQASYNCILLDVTPLRQAHESLAYQIAYDELTGLYSKVSFYQRVQDILDNDEGEHKFEIMAFDIERFKILNDLFGEDMGDFVLRSLAKQIKKLQGDLCVSSRFHSDKFLIFYPAENHNRERFLRELKALASGFTIGSRVTLRFGLYAVVDRTLAVSKMCGRAFLAVMQTKNSEAQCEYSVYTETMWRSAVAEQNIIDQMEKALERNEFIIYMQPKYDLSTETVVGAEALVRWQHPVRGMISPAEFIPVFERSGFIYNVDRFVWEETCKLLRKWIDQGRNPPAVSVNVSRVDFFNADLVGVLSDLVKRYNLPSELLELELTESAYTSNPQEIIRIVGDLQARGFTVLMDDFGSGYSSLNMLKELPVDVLKIDLKFLDDKSKTGRGGNILNSVVRMAKWMRIPVVVEGVETRDQVDFLRTIGCNYVQGYYFSKPIPVEQYENLLVQGKFVPIPAEQERTWYYKDDISELLVSSNQQFNFLFNNMFTGIGFYERDGEKLDLLRANDGLARMLGMPIEKLMGKEYNLLRCIDPEDRDLFFSTLDEARRTKAMQDAIIRRWLPSGKLLWLRMFANVLLQEGRRQVLFIGWEDMLESQSHFLLMQNTEHSFPGGICLGEVRDNRVMFYYLNDWILRMVALDWQHLQDQTRDETFWSSLLGTKFTSQFRENILSSAETRQSVADEIRSRMPDGLEHTLQATFYALRDSRGVITFCVGLRDAIKGSDAPAG